MPSQINRLIVGLAIAAAGLLVAVCARGADEIEVRASIKYAPDSILRDTAIQKFDQAGSHYSITRQTINTGAWETVTITADVATNGYGFFKNTTTNTGQYIQLATPEATNIFAQIEATQFALLPMWTNTILAMATISDTNITTAILETFIVEK